MHQFTCNEKKGKKYVPYDSIILRRGVMAGNEVQ